MLISVAIIMLKVSNKWKLQGIIANTFQEIVALIVNNELNPCRK